MARTCYDGAHAGTEAGRPAWSLWLAALGFLAGGLAVTLAVTRPLTADVLVSGAARTVEGFAARLRVQVGLDSL